MLQEFYDKTFDHFNKDGSVFGANKTGGSAYGSCVYRGDEDPKSPVRCAWGIHIPDDKYDPDMEGSSAYAVIERWELIPVDQRTNENFDFINRTQSLHDRTAQFFSDSPMTTFLQGLNNLATEAGLVTKPITRKD